jgi:hypothetical protein
MFCGSPAFAQPAVIDLSAKPAAFSRGQYSELVKCTLKKHPEETRRYATYHLTRRDVQTPDQNEADPDSKLMLPIIQSCYRLEVGKVVPFSLDALIADWGRAYNISVAPQPRIATAEALATCAMRNNPQAVAKVVTEPRPAGAIMNLDKLFGYRCSPAPNFKLDINQLYSKLDQLAAEQAARKTVQ